VPFRGPEREEFALENHPGRRTPRLSVLFPRKACRECEDRLKCTGNVDGKGRHIQSRVRKDQKTSNWQRYAIRAGCEATVAETAHAHGLRHCRYRGRAKTHVQHVLIATGTNIVRLSECFPPGTTPASPPRPPEVYEMDRIGGLPDLVEDAVGPDLPGQQPDLVERGPHREVADLRRGRVPVGLGGDEQVRVGGLGPAAAALAQPVGRQVGTQVIEVDEAYAKVVRVDGRRRAEGGLEREIGASGCAPRIRGTERCPTS